MRDKVYELVSLTHQRCDTLVRDNERVVVTGNASLEVLARQRGYHILENCQFRQRRANAGSALLALDWHWHSGGHTVKALSTLAVSAASARCRPTSMLCNIQHMTGGGVITRILCVHFCVHCTSAIGLYTRTPVLHVHADR